MPQDTRRREGAKRPLALAFCVIITACASVAAVNSSDRLRLIFVEGFPVVDGVFIKGKGPYRFLLDTGASTNQIDKNLARELGLVISYRVEFVTANGRGYLPGGRVPEISIGAVRVQDSEMIWTPAAIGVSGVIGQEFLSRFNYLLDLENHALVFDPLIQGERVPFEWVNQMAAIKVHGLGRLVLDSGASSLCLYRDPGVSGGNPSGSYLRTSAGETKVHGGKMKALRVGSHEFRQVPFVVSPHMDVVDGLLPLRLFRSVYFNNSDRYVVLNPT